MIHAAVLLAEAGLAILLVRITNVSTTKRTASLLAPTVVVPGFADLESSRVVSSMAIVHLHFTLLVLVAAAVAITIVVLAVAV